MKLDNPFDKKLEAQKTVPESIKVGAIKAVDTLDLAWAGVMAVFGSKAKPEHALMLLPILLEQAEAERRRRSERVGARKASESTPTAPRKSRRKAD